MQTQLQTELSGITDRMSELLLKKSGYETAWYCIFAGIKTTDKGVPISVTPLKKRNNPKKADLPKKPKEE